MVWVVPEQINVNNEISYNESEGKFGFHERLQNFLER